MKYKKTLVLFLVIIMSFSLTACDSFNGGAGSNENSNGGTSNEDSYTNKVLTAEEIYKNVKDSVVEIVTYKKNGEAIGQGSGFFVSNNQICTNYHVIKGAYKIEVKIPNGNTISNVLIVGYDEDKDLASLELQYYSCDKYLKTDVTAHDIGETIYTLGSSKGLTSTFSDGIISSNDRVVEGINCYQITAPISPGNSGGPLLSNQGKVLGINSMSLTSGQNLNFAIKINEYLQLDKSKELTVEEFYEDTVYMNIEIGEIKRYELESNDKITNAQILERGVTLSASIYNGYDIDYFQINLKKGQLLTTFISSSDSYDIPYIMIGLLDYSENILAVSSLVDELWVMTYTATNDCSLYLMVFRSTDYPLNISYKTPYTAFVYWK